MRRANGLYSRLRGAFSLFAMAAVLTVCLFTDAFTIVSHADSAAKITANTAKVRKEASTTSDTLASVKKGDVVTIKGQTKASDGHTWYQVVYNGNQTGYIRSDLLEITDGSTPANLVTATTGQSTGSTSNTSAPDEAVVEVQEVQSVSAKVKGSSQVRVRQNASTTSRIVSTVKGGLAMTVNGTASGTDGNDWYRVTFISNGSEVTGFIRADYVTLDGEIVAVGEAPAEQEQQTAEQPAETTGTEIDGNKAWDTYYQDDIWHLVDNATGKSYSIDQIFETVETNRNTLTEVLKTNQTQQIAVVVLVILAVILLLVISILIFKIKEMKDAAYYEKIERETVRRRAADRPVQNGQKTVRTGEGAKRPAGQQTGGQRANGTGTKGSGQRPAGQRPSGTNGTKRPAGQNVNGANKRPRPAAEAQDGEIRRRPVEKGEAERRQAEAAAAAEEKYEEQLQRAEELQAVAENSNETPVEAVQNPKGEFAGNVEDAARESGRKTGDSASAADKAKWKSKNFADDDEFEFQFLDWDEDQE